MLAGIEDLGEDDGTESAGSPGDCYFDHGEKGSRGPGLRGCMSTLSGTLPTVLISQDSVLL